MHVLTECAPTTQLLTCLLMLDVLCSAGEKVFDHHYHYEHLMELVQSALPSRGGGDADESAEGSSPDTPTGAVVARMRHEDSYNSVTSSGRLMPTLTQVR